MIVWAFGCLGQKIAFVLDCPALWYAFTFLDCILYHEVSMPNDKIEHKTVK